MANYFRFLLDEPETGQRRFTVESNPPGCQPTTMLSILISEDEAIQLYYLGKPVFEKRRQDLRQQLDEVHRQQRKRK